MEYIVQASVAGVASDPELVPLISLLLLPFAEEPGLLLPLE